MMKGQANTMLHILAVAIGATLALSIFSPSKAQLFSPYDSCRRITESMQRLACFDRAGRSARFAEIFLPEMACRRDPRPTEVFQMLINERFIRTPAVGGGDSISYFALTQPLELDSMTIIGVMGADETNSRIIARGPGTSAGIRMGFVTTARTGQLEDWRQRMGFAVRIDDVDDFNTTPLGVTAAKEVVCYMAYNTPFLQRR
ncbi:hypothetical protein [Falsiroseomonas sp. E2-1-a20]|uniref:hypothetical protein n=1 Tax=Falsiroseomonas sp. E2-1-a20 TaxID=3239300 RepID=UPI003F390480